MCGEPRNAEAQQRLEGRHGGAAPVVAEDVLVEVDGQVLVADAAVGEAALPSALTGR
jgi:hypothetical protein